MASYPTPYFKEGQILGAIYGLLVTFFLLAVVALPFVMKRLKSSGETSMISKKGVDFWFTARDSQPWYTIALSMCATGAGAWLLYTPAEAAYKGGWWGVLGYCVAISLGPTFMAVYGPRMRAQCRDGANITDWVYDRFGPQAHVWVSLVFVYYMLLYMTGQLKTMGDMVIKYTGKSGPTCPGPSCKDYTEPEHGIVPVAVFTMVYTSIGGLPASIMTDQIQAVVILVIVVVLSVFVYAEVDFTRDSWYDKASVWTDRGFEMGVSLCFAVFGAEVFNLAFWQRVFMARDDKQLRIGIGVGTVMLALLTFLFGLTGLLLKAQDDSAKAQTIFVPAFTLFEINTMASSTDGVRMLFFILATCMITSSVDSFQIGISSVLSRFMQKREVPYKNALLIGVGLTVLVNVPAVAFAQYAVNDVNATFDGLAVKITDLFSMADIMTITVLVPVFSGLWGFATKYGCLLGMFSGLATIIVWGWIEFGTFMGGMEMITMMCFGNTRKALPVEVDAQGTQYPTCGFYSKRAPKIFPTIVFVSFAVTYAVSWMDNVYTAVTRKQKELSMSSI